MGIPCGGGFTTSRSTQDYRCSFQLLLSRKPPDLSLKVISLLFSGIFPKGKSTITKPKTTPKPTPKTNPTSVEIVLPKDRLVCFSLAPFSSFVLGSLCKIICHLFGYDPGRWVSMSEIRKEGGWDFI